MREIKFRAFYKPNQKMYQVLTLDIIDSKALIEWRGESANKYLRGYVRLDDMELMQYTGMTDKNGREIYEGDIIKAVSFARWIGIVEFCDEKSAYILKDIEETPYRDGYVFLSQFEDGFEILGNIYENPELLEVE